VVSDSGLLCVSRRDLTDHDGVASSSSISEEFRGAEEYLREQWDRTGRERVQIREDLSNMRLMMLRYY